MSSSNINPAHFEEHGYCSTAYNRPVHGTFTQSQENLSTPANFYRERDESSVRQSRERGHVRSLSATDSTSGRKKRIAKRIAPQTRDLPGLRRTSATITSPNPQRLPRPNNTSPLSSISHNILSTSSAHASSSLPLTSLAHASNCPSAHASNLQSTSSSSAQLKSSDEETSSGYKRCNFRKDQTAVLNGWLKLNLKHPYPTDEEKVLLAEKAGITLQQVNNYYTNARRRSNYKKMCEEEGINPAPKKRKKSEQNSNEGEKENQIPVCGRSDSGLSSEGSRPASVQSSSSSPASSPKLVKESRDQAVADSGFSQVQGPVFVEGSGFVPAPPLPLNVGPEVLAVSRQVDPAYVDVPADGSMFDVLLSIAEKFPNADVKAYEKNRPREHYIAKELMAEIPNAVIHVRNPGRRKKNPAPKKRKITDWNSNNRVRFYQIPVPVRSRSDSGLSSEGSRPASVQSSSSSPKLIQGSSSESHDQVFVEGPGFVPAPPLPSEVSPEVVTLSREKVDPVHVDVPADGGIIADVQVHKPGRRKKNPAPKKRKISEQNINSRVRFYQIPVPVRRRPDSCLSAEGSRPATVQSSSSSPKLVQKSQDQVRVEDSGFVLAPPLPFDVSLEVLAVSREKVDDPVYVKVPADGSMFNVLHTIAEKFRNADVKAYEADLPREHYIAGEVLREHPDALVYVRVPGYDL